MSQRAMQMREYPPSLVNIDAEKQVLGGILSNNGLLHGILDLVDIEDFSEPVHQRILHEAMVMIAEGRQANPVTLRPLLIDDAALKQLGGPRYLAEMTEACSVIPHFAYDFARQISDLAARRRLLDTMRDQTEAIADVGNASIGDVTSGIDVAVARAVARRQVGNSMSLGSALDDTWRVIEDDIAGRRTRGVETMFISDWNALTGTMRPSDMITLGARPSMGKTACATSVALGAAMKGHGVLFISIEMDMHSITERMIADLLHWHRATTTYNDVQNGNIALHDQHAFDTVRKLAKTLPLTIIDPPPFVPERLPMIVRRYQREFEARGKSLDLVVLDYLQLLKQEKGESRFDMVTKASQVTKATAKECGLAMLALAQLSRDVERRENKYPALSDLRESGQIEQDSDTVIFLHRDQYYLENAKPAASDVKAKQAWDEAMAAASDRIDFVCAKRRKGRKDVRKGYFFGAHQAVRGGDFYQMREDDF